MNKKGARYGFSVHLGNDMVEFSLTDVVVAPVDRDHCERLIQDMRSGLLERGWDVSAAWREEKIRFGVHRRDS
jgi:hypothetical protein